MENLMQNLERYLKELFALQVLAFNVQPHVHDLLVYEMWKLEEAIDYCRWEYPMLQTLAAEHQACDNPHLDFELDYSGEFCPHCGTHDCSECSWIDRPAPKEQSFNIDDLPF